MVRTGRRAEVLRDLLTAAGLKPTAIAPPRPNSEELDPELTELYRRLGGLQERPRLRPGGWDLVFYGPLVIELDEELHFNRYRALTLEASWAIDLPWVSDYRRYCAESETECLSAGRWGKRWTNESCGRMFSGGPPGELDRAGAPRWKQRALYDVVKDSAPLSTQPVALARLSIYDDIDDKRLGDILQGTDVVSPGAVRALLERRTAAP